jgi:hypothetical protein
MEIASLSVLCSVLRAEEEMVNVKKKDLNERFQFALNTLHFALMFNSLPG